MVATVGRSARFGERSCGSPDPGATSLAIIVEALVGAVVGPDGDAVEDRVAMIGRIVHGGTG